jgi:hypothetical protein
MHFHSDGDQHTRGPPYDPVMTYEALAPSINELETHLIWSTIFVLHD